MKKIQLLAFLISLSTAIYAQNYIDDQEDKAKIKSLISKDNELKPFGSLDFKTGNTNDQLSLLIGAHGGLLVNKNVILGIGTYGWVSNPQVTNAAQTDLDLDGGYAGFILGYKFFPKEIVHLSFPILVGGGQIRLKDPDYFVGRGSDSWQTVESSGFFVVDPCAQLEVNVSAHLRIAAGAGYRFVTGSSLDSIDDAAISDFYGMLSLQVGIF